MMDRAPTRNELSALRREDEPANGHTCDNPIYHQLKKMVIDCSFLPGDPLPVAELGDRLGVSGTPVREALNRLRAEGLILSIPHKGFFAKGLDLQEIGDLYRLGFLLISYSIRRYPAKCAAPDVADLPLAWVVTPFGTHRCDAIAPTAAQIEAFYRRVVAVSQNEAMMSVLENFIDRTHYVRMLDLQMPERADEITDRFHSLAQILQREDTNEALAHLERLLERKLEMKLSLPIRNLRAIRAEASASEPLRPYREWAG